MRIASSLIVALLFLSISMFAFNVQPARAQLEIIINPDGSISSPVPANITTSDNITYTFTGDNHLTIVVNRSSIIINGMGYVLQVSWSTGFSLSGVSNVTIENTTITNNYYGIFLDSSSSDVVSRNNIMENKYGIFLYNSSGNTLSRNNITENSNNGIILDYSCDGNTLSGNNVTANGYGIWLLHSSGNVLSDNEMTGNNAHGNFEVYGSALSDFVNYIDNSNTVNGKPVYYLMNKSNVIISLETCSKGVGYIALIGCSNVTVQGLTLAQNGEGILLANTVNSKITDNNIMANSRYGIYLDYSCENNTLSDNNITANWDGIYLSASSGNVLSDNNVLANSGNGIVSSSSFGNAFSGNNVTGTSGDGIFLFYSSNNTLYGNNFTENWNGIDLQSSSGNTFSSNLATTNRNAGIYLDYSCDNNTFYGNEVKANSNRGIWLAYSYGNSLFSNDFTANWDGLYLYSSSGNVLNGNNIIANSEYGIFLDNSSGNMIFHNDFFNNTPDAIVSNSISTWDDDYPSGGNYWSDYLDRYPNATDIDASGIGDTAYVIDANNTDNYPLMGVFSSFNTSYGFAIDFVSNSSISDFRFIVSPPLATVTFNLSGESSTQGFVRVCIPNALINGSLFGLGSYIVLFDGQRITDATYPQVKLIPSSNQAYEYLYINYTHSEHTITITGMTTIPEFPSFLILPIFMIVALATVMLYKRKHLSLRT